jgi:hypothetical protein
MSTQYCHRCHRYIDTDVLDECFDLENVPEGQCEIMDGYEGVVDEISEEPK